MMNSSCLLPILNLKVGKNKTKKKKNRKKKLYVREVNHNRCPRDSQPLCARTSSVCDSLQVGESRCSSSMHGRRGWPVCLSPWRISYRHFTKACLFSSWSNSAAGIDDLRRLHPQVLAALITWQWKTLRVKAQTTTWGGGITEEWDTPTQSSNHETQRTTGAELTVDSVSLSVCCEQIGEVIQPDITQIVATAQCLTTVTFEGRHLLKLTYKMTSLWSL